MDPCPKGAGVRQTPAPSVWTREAAPAGEPAGAASLEEKRFRERYAWANKSLIR